MKFHGPFRDVQLAGDLFVGKIFQQRIEDFLFAAAEVRDGIGLQPAALAGENGIYESGEKLPRNPESSAGNERERANQLLAGFHVGQKPLDSKAQKRKTVRFIVLLPDDDEAGFGIAFHKIGQKRTGSGFGGVGVDDVDLGAGRSTVRRSGASVDSSCLENTLNGAFARMRSNSLSTKGWGERMQTASLEEARLVVTVCQGIENWPKGQVPLTDLSSNCY